MTVTGHRRLRIGPDADRDRYVIEHEVATGAEGRLFRGSITVSGLTLDVAIKQLLPERLPVEAWRKRWTQQVELLRTLQGPGVVPVREGFAGALPHAEGTTGSGRTLYLVMNWVEGEPLHDWVQRRPDEDPFSALERLLPVAAALDDMHAGKTTGGKAVLHGDIKPSNILVGDTNAVLVDFGLIRALPEGPRISGLSGTPGYMAPESWSDGIYDPATDRYGFGAVAYFVFTRTEPPYGYDRSRLRTALAEAPALVGRPRTLDHIMRLLDADPGARPDSLCGWITELRVSNRPQSTVPPPQSRATALEQRAKSLRGALFDLAEAHFVLEGDPEFALVRAQVDPEGFWMGYTVAKGLLDDLDAALAARRLDEAERLLGPEAVTLPDGTRTGADRLWADLRVELGELEATVRRQAHAAREQLLRLDALRQQVCEAHRRAVEVGAGDDPEVTRVLGALVEADTAVAQDPWASHATDGLVGAVEVVMAHVEDLEERKATFPDRLADARVLLERISEHCVDGARAFSEAVAKISAPDGLLEPLDCAAIEGDNGEPHALRPWLERIEREAEAGGWRVAENALRRWKQVADGWDANATTVLEANLTPRRHRDILRGRLRAARAMAGATGKDEDPRLTAMYTIAREALYRERCDLTSARSKVQEYIAAVNEPPEGEER